MPGFSNTTSRTKYIWAISVIAVFIFVGGGLFILLNQQDSGRVLSSGTDNADNILPSKNVITYVSDRDGNNEIYLQDVPARKEQRVTDTKVSEFSPSLSRDGRKLVFLSEEDGFFGIWVYSLESYEKRLVSITRAEPLRASFSPDGFFISYLEKEADQTRLYVVNTITGNKERVAVQVEDFAWSDDSSTIVYTSNTTEDITKTEIIIRTISENGKLENSNTLFVGGVAPVFVSGNEKVYFMDISGEYLSLASVSLRGEGYVEEFMIKIRPENSVLYQLSKRSAGGELMLLISSKKQLMESLHISLKDRVALPVDSNISAISWTNSDGIIYTAKEDNENSHIWLKTDYEQDPVQVTNTNNNWF